MKKSLIYIFPLLPLAIFYGLVASNVEEGKKSEVLSEKVKELEEKLSQYAKPTNRQPATKKYPEVELSRNQVEHLIRFKGCRVFSKEGQNFITCPEQSKSKNRFI